MPIPVDLKAVVLTALLNPAVVVVALWMGRKADQWQKLPVAAFAAAVAGSALVYIAVWLGVRGVAGVGRAAAGVFIAEFVFGLAWACAGFRLRTLAGVTLLQLWLAATLVVLTVIAVWAFAPVLVFVVLLAAVLGVISAAMILLARRLQLWRDRR